MKLFSLIFFSILLSSCINEKPTNNKGDLFSLTAKDSFAIELIALHDSDQIARKNNRYFQSLDSVNFDELMLLIKTYGYPSKNNLHEKHYQISEVQEAATSIFLHNPHRLVNEKQHLDILLEEVEKGNLNMDYLITFLDKYYLYRRDDFGNSTLMYGSQFGKPCLKYKRESDSLRKIIGLQPLQQDDFKLCK